MHGYVIVDKPVGQSSNGVVQEVRRVLGIGGRRGTKAGHAGTLDPFATGLVVVLVGHATRLMPHVVGHDKRYLLDVQLGAWSTTDDIAGELTEVERLGAWPTRAQVVGALTTLADQREQVPPQVSALHVDGERAYRRVLRGEQLDLPTRPVRFDSIELVNYDEQAGLLSLDVRCAAGTYMRALARDLGAVLETGAYASALRRSEVGVLTVAGAPAPAEVTAADLRPMAELVTGLPKVQLEQSALDDFAHGRFLDIGADVVPATGEAIVVLDQRGELAGLAHADDERPGVLKPDAVFIQPAQQEVRA